MHLIKLNATDSTNSYLRALSTEKVLEDYTIVTASHQTKGRGQLGAIWDSEKDKNLICSVFKRHVELPIEKHFFISIVVSLSIVRALQKFQIPRLHIKWPNDILSEQKKICGILIENVIKQNAMEGSIIGIGLNINQTSFIELPNAASLRMLMGNVYNELEILEGIVNELRVHFNRLNLGEYVKLKAEYENLLFRKNKPSTFKHIDGHLFPGYIQGVNDSGLLQVLLEDDLIKAFDLKELKLLY